METLESLSSRIETTEDIHGIVRTMKALSAVSIRQYEAAMEALDLYGETVELGLSAVLRRRPPDLRRRRGAGGPGAAIVFGSDRGLCGRFNERLADRVEADVGTARDDGRGVPRLLVIGGRMATLLEARGVSVETAHMLPGSAGGLTRAAQAILMEADRWRAGAGIERIEVFHNRRAEGAEGGATEPISTVLIPPSPETLRELAEREWPGRSLPDFRMEAGALFSWLIRERLLIGVARAAAHSLAGEHAARLAAMQAAERNIEERLETLSARRRRTRQTAITSELLDIVGGVEAMRRREDEREADEDAAAASGRGEGRRPPKRRRGAGEGG
ncbi:MAG: F0F1 ATP synthase subunit gamma [Paracoccaceae bacterium]